MIWVRVLHVQLWVYAPPHLPLLFLPMLFISTLFVRMQPYLVLWNISEAQEALKSVNELCVSWSFSQRQRRWEKSRNRGKWKVQQRKSKLHFCRPLWLVCSVVVVGTGHYLITAFYNQSPFSFYLMVSFPEAPPPLVLRHSASLSSSSRSAVRCLALESETGLCLRQVNCLWDSCANGANPTFVKPVLSVWAC